MRPTPHDIDVDVAIVGFGPVGQALAVLLGRAGHSVLAVERFAEIYRLPRAVHLDHEIMRLLQGLDVADDLAGELLSVRDYHWYGADGEPLMTLEAPVPAASGWDPDYMFFQPALERALERRASEQPSVTVERGWAAEVLTVEPDHALLSVRRVSGERPEGIAAGEARSIRARWVVGADGANSFVRETRGIGRRDLGFRERWLVVDLEPHDLVPGLLQRRRDALRGRAADLGLGRRSALDDGDGQLAHGTTLPSPFLDDMSTSSIPRRVENSKMRGSR